MIITCAKHNRTAPVLWALALGLCMALLGPAPPLAKAGVGDKFGVYDKASTVRVDHSAFDALLQAYVTAAEGGLTRVDYAAFKADGHGALKAYLGALQGVDVARLGRDEQFAFWANLYNAKTLDIVLEHYPVKSIRDIDISPGLSDGPWGKKVVRVGGVELSLNDIEHGILRPLWRDPRVHYAVNCASLGCPNLRRQAFRGAGLGEMLDQAAADYVNSPRGLTVSGGKVTASAIFSWYRADFGPTPNGVLDHIRRYAAPSLRGRLEGVTYVTQFAYDWSLNDVEGARVE